MRFVTSNIEQFKVFFDVTYDVASEDVELIFYQDRMTCAVLDGNRARFFYVQYDLKFFDEFDVDEVGSVCVSMEDMYKLLKIANKTDVLTMEFTDETMSVELESKNGNKRFFEFVLPDGYVQSPKLPKAQMPSHFELDVVDIKQSVKDIEQFGTDIFQFILSEDRVALMSDSTLDTGSFSSVKYAQEIEVETGVTEQMAVRFTLKFIKQMLDFNKISKTISIDMGEMALLYEFKDELMGVTVNGMIAPRIMESDE